MSERSATEIKYVEEAPEGGWGYVIMLSIVFGCLASFGYMPCMGIMYADFLADLGLHTRALTMLPSYFFICFSPVGLIANYLFNRFSVRSVGIFGAIVFCSGSMMVIFVRSLNELLFAYSFMQGIGFGFFLPAMYTMFNRYFIRRRVTMIGLVASMTGVVSVGMPTFIETLMQLYGFRGCMAILAALNLHVLLGMVALLPVDWWHQKRVPPTIEIVQQQSCSNSIGLSKTSIWSKVVDFLDLSLLYQPVYVNICLGMALALFSDLTFFTIQPTYLRELSFDKMNTAYVVSIGASADLGSRVVVTIVSSCTTKIKARHLFLAGMIATVAAQFVFLYVTSFTGISVVTAMLGFFRAWLYVPLAIVFADYLPPERFPSGYGLFMFAQGLVMFVVGPAVGWVRDYTQNFAITFMLLTLAMLSCAISWIVELLVISFRNTRRRRRNNAEFVCEQSAMCVEN